MYALLNVLDLALTFYIYILIASAILSWLVAFGVINTSNQVVSVVGDFVYRLTEPALRPLRAIIPSMGGIDLSFIVLYFLLIFIQSFVRTDLPRLLGGFY
jgi:YggT family protein